MKTSDDDNATFLHIKEQSVRETMHASPSPATVYYWEPSWIYRDVIDCPLDSPLEPLAQFRPNSVVPLTGGSHLRWLPATHRLVGSLLVVQVSPDLMPRNDVVGTLFEAIDAPI